MIASFKDEETRLIFEGRRSRHYPADIQNTARRKLVALDQAHELRDLLAPPGNRLEALKREREGQYSIRVNDQWRICFVWRDAAASQTHLSAETGGADKQEGFREYDRGRSGSAHDVELVDYH